MPTLEVFLPAGHDDARKAELIARLTGATVDARGAPVESVRVLLTELPATHIGLGGRRAADGAPPRSDACGSSPTQRSVSSDVARAALPRRSIHISIVTAPPDRNTTPHTSDTHSAGAPIQRVS